MRDAMEYQELSQVAAIDAERLDRARQSSLFDRLHWAATMAQHCQGDDARVLKAHVGESRSWMFLTQPSKRRLSALANYYSFAWRPVFVGATDAGIKQHLVAECVATIPRTIAHVDLYPVQADDGTRDLLLMAFRVRGWIAMARPMGTNHVLQLHGRNFDQYWAERPGALRTTVRRKVRNSTLTFEIHRHFDPALWSEYEDIYARSWKPAEGSMPFLRAIAEEEGRAGTLRLGFARRDGRAVAAQFWTVENGVALIHKLAHDRADDALSPGTLLSVHMFREAIDTDNVETIDYGTGDNAYKAEWMEECRTLYSIDAFNPRIPSHWLPAIKCKISQLVGRRGKG